MASEAHTEEGTIEERLAEAKARLVTTLTGDPWNFDQREAERTVRTIAAGKAKRSFSEDFLNHPCKVCGVSIRFHLGKCLPETVTCEEARTASEDH